MANVFDLVGANVFDLVDAEMVPVYRRFALQALGALTTEQLQRGMLAFEHPPRGMYARYPSDHHGCFVYEASCGALKMLFTENLFAYQFHAALSTCYEKDNEWFRSECIRELAERGVTVEPPAVTASVP